MGLSIHVWSLYALTLCTPSRELPDATTNRLVVAGADVTEFIHTNTSCAALQEKLHECDRWFIVSSVRSSVTIVYYI